jgi:hypothetical protein
MRCATADCTFENHQDHRMVDTAFATIPGARGDMLHRKSLRWGIAALLGLLALLPCTIWARTILMALATFGPLGFKIGASAWALVLAVGLIAFVCGGLTALFLRVEASVNTRSRRRLAGDLLAALLVLIITFAPTIVALYPPVHALFTHTIGFRGLGQQYPRAEDPYGYWQAVAFWFMGAATLGYLACVYWRWKWRQYKGLHAVTPAM